MIPLPGAPREALNTGLNPAPEEETVKEVCLVWGTDKGLEKDGESQAQATSRTVRKISMALISKKGLGVKRLVILIQVTIEDHTQQVSQVVVENKGMFATQTTSLSVLGVVEDKTTGQIQMSLLVMVMSLAHIITLNRDGMNQMQNLNQETVKSKDTVQVDQVNIPALDNMALPQESLLAVESMDLA